MITFNIKADATFTAENLDDAYEQLMEYFADLSIDITDTRLQVQRGTISVEQTDSAASNGVN